MPMFDIEDSSNVTLDKNKTSRDKLAKIKNVHGFSATDNEAAVTQEKKDDEILELKPNFIGFGINLRALWRKLTKN